MHSAHIHKPDRLALDCVQFRFVDASACRALSSSVVDRDTSSIPCKMLSHRFMPNGKLHITNSVFFLVCTSYSSERYAFQNAMGLCTHVCNHILYRMWIRRAELILQRCAILVYWIRGKCQREKIQFLIRSLVFPLPLICSLTHGIFCMLNIYMYIISLCIFSSHEVSACIKHIICQAKHLSTLPNRTKQQRQWTCAAIIIMVIEYKK